jgi:hypothetical protein
LVTYVPRNAGRGSRCTAGTVATTAIITEPADVRLHIDVLESLAEVADSGADARETLIELRDGYKADT